MNLKNKTILLTGASKGIGLSLSKALDKEGASLILVSRTIDNELCDKHKCIQADLTKKEDRDNLLSQIDKLDGLLNVAGVGIHKFIEDQTEEEWRQVIELNLNAPYLLTKGVIGKLRDSDLSLVLNIGSGAGVMPFKRRASYCASKYGLRGMTLSLARDYEDRKLDFCLITLGSVMTSFGGKSTEKQEERARRGAESVFPVEWVADRLVEIIKDENRKTEIVLYPSEYGPDSSRM